MAFTNLAHTLPPVTSRPETMQINVWENVVLAVWHSAQLRDLDRILEHIKLARVRTGKRVHYIARVPADSPLPNDDIRKAVNRRMPELLENVWTYHSVMEGNGLRNGTVRAIMASIFLISGKRNTFFVHPTAEHILSDTPAAEREVMVRALVDFSRDDLLGQDLSHLAPAGHHPIAAPTHSPSTLPRSYRS
jgi:hypothetical protein